MPNPLVPQGTLNRLRGSIQVTAFPELNVTASYLGKEGIGLSFGGVITTPIMTMTGVVQSPEPYQEASLTIHLLKTQAFANQWKIQLESSSLLGDMIINPDSVNLGSYALSNMAINNINPLSFAGTNAEYVVMCSGIYYVNSSLWNQ